MIEENDGQASLVKDAIHALHELYRAVAGHDDNLTGGNGTAAAAAAVTPGTPGTNVPLRDLCHDTLALVNQVPDYEGSTMITAQEERAPSPMAIDSTSESAVASTVSPQHSPTSEKEGLVVHDKKESMRLERSPLKRSAASVRAVSA